MRARRAPAIRDENASPAARRRTTGDDGTALVEAAFIAPVFFLLLFSIVEFGWLFLTYSSVGDAAISGSRTISVAGKDALADFQTLNSIGKSLGVIKPAQIVRVVFWKAPSATADITTATANGGTACAAGSAQSGFCNVYTPANVYNFDPNVLALHKSEWGCTDANPSAKDCSWRPIDRKDADTPNGSDFVGVYVVYGHKYMTGVFGTNKTVTAQSVFRIEPHTLS